MPDMLFNAPAVLVNGVLLAGIVFDARFVTLNGGWLDRDFMFPVPLDALACREAVSGLPKTES